VYEDLLNIKGETESTMRRFNATILKLSESLEKEGQERNEFIERIPKTIEIRPSEDYLNLNKSFEKNSKFMKNIFYGMIAALFLSVLTTAGNIFFTKQWYVESIKSKSEIRQEILDEIKKDGQSIYKDEDYLQLQHNTELMNKWMRKTQRCKEFFEI
jgi:high-affinity Fe2+/Pb2+ permease